jgi:hypothetical protein
LLRRCTLNPSVPGDVGGHHNTAGSLSLDIDIDADRFKVGSPIQMIAKETAFGRFFYSVIVPAIEPEFVAGWRRAIPSHFSALERFTFDLVPDLPSGLSIKPNL